MVAGGPGGFPCGSSVLARLTRTGSFTGGEYATTRRPESPPAEGSVGHPAGGVRRVHPPACPAHRPPGVPFMLHYARVGEAGGPPRPAPRWWWWRRWRGTARWIYFPARVCASPGGAGGTDRCTHRDTGNASPTHPAGGPGLARRQPRGRGVGRYRPRDGRGGTGPRLRRRYGRGYGRRNWSGQRARLGVRIRRRRDPGRGPGAAPADPAAARRQAPGTGGAHRDGDVLRQPHRKGGPD